MYFSHAIHYNLALVLGAHFRPQGVFAAASMAFVDSYDKAPPSTVLSLAIRSAVTQNGFSMRG